MLLQACTTASSGSAQSTSPAVPGPCLPGQTSRCCGDGTCDGPETPENCDADCRASTTSAAPPGLGLEATGIPNGIPMGSSDPGMVTPSAAAGERPEVPAQPLSPCECSADSTSGGVQVPYIGCNDHFGDGDEWCYVGGGIACETAAASAAQPGAAYRSCADTYDQCVKDGPDERDRMLLSSSHSLRDVAGLVGTALSAANPACLRCLLGAVAQLCGAGCIGNGLHLVVSVPLPMGTFSYICSTARFGDPPRFARASCAIV